ncbi:internal scaffolding protein [Blackfly microvirus SF02]|uniref:Internal scaffolding protein n=1 Tax=Blackfly microvirus SF02 TaxID=2576452 RepID=A0A4P8PJN0_9VIRU|nr:internal scaffolding protein [Blackfly microvirus SF02]
MTTKQQHKMPDGEIQYKDIPQWKTPNNHDTNFESDRTALYCNDISLTQQQFKEEADINNIINKFLQGGMPPPPVLPEHFADLSEKLTYLDVETKLAEANAIFYGLPAEIRSESNNSPSIWADKVSKAVEKRDGDKLNELGVALPERIAAEQAAQAAQEAAKAAEAATKAAAAETAAKATKGL